MAWITLSSETAHLTQRTVSQIQGVVQAIRDYILNYLPTQVVTNYIIKIRQLDVTLDNEGSMLPSDPE